MTVTRGRNGAMTTSFLISIVLHAIVVTLFILFPPIETPRKYKEILIDLAPEEPEPIPQTIERPETPTPVPRERLVQATPQPEPTPVQPDSLAAQPTPAPTPTPPSQATRSASSASPAARIPSSQDYLGDVADLQQLAQSPTARTSSTTPNTTPDLSSAVSTRENNDSAALGQEFQNQNRLESLSAAVPSTPNSSQSSAQQSTSVPIDQQLRELRAQMASQYVQQNNSTNDATGPAAQNSGFADDRIQGQPGTTGRGLVSADRLNLSKYLTGPKNPNWPSSVTVQFQVNRDGFVRILNESAFSAYTELSLALYRLFVRDGQVFVSAPSTPSQEGSITFRLN